MQRNETMIELADHVKERIRQYKMKPEEFEEESLSEDPSNLSDSTATDSEESDELRRPRIYRIVNLKETIEGNKNSTNDDDLFSISNFRTDDKYCRKCRQFERRFLVEQRQNKKLMSEIRQLMVTIELCQAENSRLKSKLNMSPGDSIRQQKNLHSIKENYSTNRKFTTAIDEDKPDKTNEHLKRLRHEIQMYNRLVAAKEFREEREAFKRHDHSKSSSF